MGSSSADPLTGGTSDWQEVTLTALPPRGADHGEVFLRADAESGEAWFDDVKLTVNDIPVKTKIADQTDLGADRASAPVEAYAADYPEDKDRLAKGFKAAANTLWSQGEKDKAIVQASRCLSNSPNQEDRKLRLKLADWYLQNGQLKEARTMLDDLARNPTDKAEAFRIAATRCESMQEEAGNETALVEAAKKLVDEYPDESGEAFFRLGRAEVVSHHYADAEPHLATATQQLDKGSVTPLLVSAKTWLGIADIYTGHAAEAVTALWDVVKKYPFTPDAKLAIEYLYNGMVMQKDASGMRQLSDWIDATWTDPEYVNHRAYAQYSRGRAAEVEGDDELAKSEYQKTQTNFPDNYWAKNALEAIRHIETQGGGK
jgi:tetratricopeptide (TPR) repeat protein